MDFYKSKNLYQFYIKMLFTSYFWGMYVLIPDEYFD